MFCFKTLKKPDETSIITLFLREGGNDGQSDDKAN